MPRPLGLKHTPETRDRIAASRVAFLDNPQERARISDTLRRTCAVPARRQRMIETACAAWADPDTAARMLQGQRAHLPPLTDEQRRQYKVMLKRGFQPQEILEAMGVAV